MTQIRCIYNQLPAFPATDQHPDAVRYAVAGYFVDAVGGEPTQADIDAFFNRPLENIAQIEVKNPITHRALRELILTIGEVYPSAKNTVFYQRVLAVDVAIQAERAKL